MATEDGAPPVDSPRQSDGKGKGHSAAPALKPVHSLVLDAGPLIKNDLPISTLLASADELYTVPAVLTEIRDEATRSRVETTLLPFLKQRAPKPASVNFISLFARRSGDLEVLSRCDIHLLALTYELECERVGNDGRLRKVPSRRRQDASSAGVTAETAAQPPPPVSAPAQSEGDGWTVVGKAGSAAGVEPSSSSPRVAMAPTEGSPEVADEDALASLSISATKDGEDGQEEGNEEEDDNDNEEEEDDDEEGWFTPENLHENMAKDRNAVATIPDLVTAEEVLPAAVLTSDYAMQNVALRIGLHLLAPSLARITHVKTWVLRCHGCFKITRDMTRQFCPNCGQATLTRTSCSTDADGNLTVHLKANFQWNKRGNVYSIPKPIHGSASGKRHKNAQGGGKGGWGAELMLAEDQKEYTRAKETLQREKMKDLMDEDYLPHFLSGGRASASSGKIKVGAGRNVNSRKRF